MAYGDFKNLNERIAANKLLSDKAFSIAQDPKYDGYHVDLLHWSIHFSIKTSPGSSIKNRNISNKELAEEPHKPIIREFNKRKVHSPFIDNIWGAYLADMQLMRKINKGFRFLLCFIDIYRDMHGLFL